MRRLPWVILGVSATTSLAGLALLVQVPSAAIERTGGTLALQALFVVVMLVFGIVGAVVASRLPANPIGWLFLGLSLFDGIFELANGYTHYTLSADPGSLPGAPWAAWVSNWTSPLAPPFLVAALLLFPDGRPPTPRWRWVLWLCAPLLVVLVLQHVLAPGPIDEFPALENPVAIDGADWLGSIRSQPFVFALFLAAAAALIVRFRRSNGVERQQVKWFAFAAAMMAAYLVLSSIAQALFGGQADEDSLVAGFAFAVFICGVPISAGIAILRHRLYDVDVVINRALVYGALTATLGGAYLALVLLLGLTVGESDLAVAASTLAVAALFGPARARVQALVDRRFYRRRYDAEQTLLGFVGRLRDELDLEMLGADLRAVVRDTMQPAHVSLWLRRSP